jgi:hypothetical protein
MRRRPAHELRTAVDCLPLSTREAMLDGIESSRIIVGAYVDRQGGMCPMLAAHRNGGRTSLSTFAKAWDRYTKANGRPRPATERELNTLRAMLEVSIAVEQSEELESALEARKRNGNGNGHTAPRPKRDTGERDRTKELRGRHGWAWLRPFKRLDDYELALDELERIEAARAERERELV